MKRISLNGQWRGECVGEFFFPAQVPGCTITDLIENKYLPKDLLVGKNAEAVQKYEKSDWLYTKTFYVEQLFENMQLRFERIDTYADIYVNGQFLASTENGNICHVFDISKIVHQGDNTLELRLYSPITRVEGLPLRYANFTAERLNTRRKQCTYGWDWVARFVCCGIGETELICWEDKESIVKNTYIFTESVRNQEAFVKIETAFEKSVNGVITFEVVAESGDCVYQENVCVNGAECELRAYIENAQLWYPVGYGKQPLYTLRIKEANVVLYEEKFGIRTVEILEIVDKKDSENYKKCLQIKNSEYDFNEEYSCFILVVNGIKIMCKGANWVPCQPYDMQGREEKITQILQLSAEMGLNMIRVWGGGAFECKHFYEECSRLGILVTQDFLMACGEYPEKEEWFLNHLQHEAEYACYLMRNQPCLVWYSGDNENAVDGSFDDEDYRGKTAYEKGLKPVVNRLDRMRKIFPSSPYGGKKFASNTVGTTHNTQFLSALFAYIESGKTLNDYKEELKKYRARFIAEEPIYGATSLSSLRRFMSDEEIFSQDMDMWLFHSKGNPALSQELMVYMIHFAERVLGEFKTPQDRYFKFQYFMYEWLRVIMEQTRREKWFCSGVVFWMLNDCWTAASGWALIDYFNKPKLGYYSFKRCAKSIVGSIDFENGKYTLYISNDSLTDCQVDVTLYKVKNGLQQKVNSFALNAPANECVAQSLNISLQPDEVLIAELESPVNDCRAFYKHEDLNLQKVENSVEYSVENGQVVLVAKAYVHAVVLEGEAIFEDNGFSMLAGEKKIVPYRYLQDALNQGINVETYTLSIMKTK
jgi:beta-mannosidase